MTIHEAREQLIHSLLEIYDDREAGNISELVMEHITRWPRIEQIENKTVPLSVSQKQLLEQIIKRLQLHEPVQYILQEAWFAGLRFYVDKNVLIPRPETEELVQWVVEDVRNMMHEMSPSHDVVQHTPDIVAPKRILDIGTGSGCIAITLKNKLPETEIWACDISDEVLNVARMNADPLNAQIDFIPVDFLNAKLRKQLPNVDIIVSNPPYVPGKNKTGMRKNVVEYEPATALFVPDNDPLLFYEAIADFGKEKLNEQGSIYVEIHEDLGKEVRELFQSKNYHSIELKKDLQGKERMIRIRNKN